MKGRNVALIFVAAAFGIGIFLDVDRSVKCVEGLVFLSFVYFLIGIYLLIQNENCKYGVPKMKKPPFPPAHTRESGLMSIENNAKAKKAFSELQSKLKDENRSKFPEDRR